MEMKKAVLTKKIDDTTYQIYPKTSADIVVCGNSTVAEILTNFANKLINYVDEESMDASIKAACSELYNKIMGITDEDGATVSEAYDTLKEVAKWIDEHGDVISGLNTSFDSVTASIDKINSDLSVITVDGGEI